jgi:predicted nicotinamide N-methyase
MIDNIMEYKTVQTVEPAGSLRIAIEAVKDLDEALEQLVRSSAPQTVEEENRILDLCPYFAIVWPAARGLAQFVAERKSLWKGKKGLELGCGLALPSIVTTKLGASVTATDFHPDVGPWVTKNAELNHIHIPFQIWDWRVAESAPQGPFDFVLASDILYEKHHPETLAACILPLLKPDGRLYLSDPGRGYLEAALQSLKDLGFHSDVHSISVEESSHRPEERLEQRRTVFVYELSR